MDPGGCIVFFGLFSACSDVVKLITSPRVMPGDVERELCSFGATPSPGTALGSCTAARSGHQAQLLGSEKCIKKMLQS